MGRMVSTVLGASSQRSNQNSSGWFHRNVIERFASVFRAFTPITLNYTISLNRNLFNAISRPSFKERVGLTDHFSVPFDTLTTGGGITGIQRNQETESSRSSFNVGTGLRFLGATFSIRPNWISSQNSSTNLNRRQRNTTWPEMSLRWSPNPRNMGDFGRLIRRIEVSSGYSRRNGRTTDLKLSDLISDISTTESIDSNEAGITRTTTTTLSPLIGFVLDLNAGLVVRGNFTTIDDINARLQFTRNTSRILISRFGGDFQSNNGQNQNRLSVTTDYRFSRYIRGGLTVEFTNTQNVITQQKRVRRGGGLWTEFLFN